MLPYFVFMLHIKLIVHHLTTVHSYVLSTSLCQVLWSGFLSLCLWKEQHCCFYKGMLGPQNFWKNILWTNCA